MPALEHQYAGTKKRRKIDIVSHTNDDLPLLRRQTLQDFPYSDLVFHIERRGGLIEQEKLGVLRNGAGNPYPLLLSAGKTA